MAYRSVFHTTRNDKRAVKKFFYVTKPERKLLKKKVKGVFGLFRLHHGPSRGG